MRYCYAFALLLGTAICFQTGICLESALIAEETTNPVNPFADPAPPTGSVSASISDEPQPSEQRTGFSLPKFTLPKLPTPKLPSLALPKMQMPKLAMPQWTKRETTSTARRPSNQPSTFEKLNSGTKSMFAKTRDTLMPWTVDEAPQTVRSATGSRASTGFSRTRVASNRSGGGSEASGEKKSLFSSWLKDSDQEGARPPRTTVDFLKQDRPQPN